MLPTVPAGRTGLNRGFTPTPASGLQPSYDPLAGLAYSSRRALVAIAEPAGGCPRRDPGRRLRRPRLEAARAAALRPCARGRRPPRRRNRLLRRDAGIHGRVGPDAAIGPRI